MSIKRTIYLLTMTLILCIMTLGYAALQERVDVEVEASIDSTYRVEITRVQVGTANGDARSTGVPSYTNDSNNMTATFNVGLTNDTDYITYTIEITNYSTVDIRVNEIEINKTNNNMKVSKIGITNGDIILAGGTKTFTVKIKLTDATSEEQTGTITILPKVTRLKGGLGSVVEETYDAYEIGDIVFFAGSNWYVIEDSGTSQDYVVLLKEKVLNNEELGEYAAGSGYDTVKFANESPWPNDYTTSNVKSALEEYMATKLNSSKLKEVEGYKIRLITVDELLNDLGWTSGTNTRATTAGNNVPIWVYSNYGEGQNNVSAYWTMTPEAGNDNHLWCTSTNIFTFYSYTARMAARPVINLYKAAID